MTVYFRCCALTISTVASYFVLSCKPAQNRPPPQHSVAATQAANIKEPKARSGEDRIEDWVLIATIPSKEAPDRASKALTAAGIPSLIGGSLAFGVRVRPSDRDRAVEALRGDATTVGYRLWIDDERSSEAGSATPIR
jgi:hypothetical protein